MMSLGVVSFAGCERPLRPDTPEGLHRSLIESVERELTGLPEVAPGTPPQRTTQPAGEVEKALASRRDELERMAGPGAYRDETAPYSPDLTGAPQQEVAVSLQQAIATSVKNNLSVQIARLQPAIREADVVAAEARFDAVFFSNLNHTRLDEPTTVPVLNGIPLGSSVNVREQTVFETGIRKPLTTGGSLSLSSTLSRARSKTPNFSLTPDPGYTARIALGIDQPLLRGFGSDVNEAQIRLARNDDRRSIQQLKSELLALIERVESAYWDLVVARRALLIRRRVLEEGIEVRDRMERRQVRDVTPSQFADAVATVERRRADVIRANRAVRAASDILKQLMNDPAVTVGSELLVSPVDFMVEQPLEFDLRQALVTALTERPEVSQALLALDDAAIGVTVADNLRLPLLNFSARMEYIGLDDAVSGSIQNAFDNSFIDYVVGLAFEQPIGNRAAEAGYRQSRLQQSAAAIAYRQTVQSIVHDVKSALRDVAANYELIQATRSFRLAQTENLRTLLVEEEFKAGLTPEFLNLKFQRQDTLAAAELQELEALSNFNKAVARLYRAMGVGMSMNGITFGEE